MNRKNTWTAAEDSVVLSEMNKNPQNYRTAFEAASRQLHNRSPDACCHRFYNSIKKAHPVVVLATSERQFTNSKTVKRLPSGDVRIEDAISYVTNLPLEYQKLIKKLLSLKIKQKKISA